MDFLNKKVFSIKYDPGEVTNYVFPPHQNYYIEHT